MGILFSKTLEEIKRNRCKGKKSELCEFYDKNIVYKWDINDKSYIGITTNLQIRIKNYLANVHDDHYISRAINKYNDSEIKFSIIKICESLEELKSSESFYIEYFDTFSAGYNLTTGGECCIISEESREKMIKAAKNKKEVFFFSIAENKIECSFESTRASSRHFDCNPSTIFAALRNKTIFRKKYKVSYDKADKFFFEETKHKNTNIMKKNRNGTKYLWTLAYEDGKVFKEDSLKKLHSHCPEVSIGTFRRIAENKMKTKKFNFKISKESKENA